MSDKIIEFFAIALAAFIILAGFAILKWCIDNYPVAMLGIWCFVMAYPNLKKFLIDVFGNN